MKKKIYLISSLIAMAIMSSPHVAAQATWDVDRTYGTSCGVTPLAAIGGQSVFQNNPSCGGCRVGTSRGTFIYPDGSAVSEYEITLDNQQTVLRKYLTN